MRKQNTNKPSAIITSDWHLRDSIPRCRMDDFWKTQWNKVAYIKSLQKRYKIPILHGGDLFHTWKCPPLLLSQTILKIPDNFHTIIGNHDMPEHNKELMGKSGLFTMEVAGALNVIKQNSYGDDSPLVINMELNTRKIIIAHEMSSRSTKTPYASKTPLYYLKKYPEADLIIMGHNHKPFKVEYKGRLFVSPGSLTRQESSQYGFKPRVYFYYSESNTLKAHYIPIESPEFTIRKDILKQSDKIIESKVLRFIQNLKKWELIDGDMYEAVGIYMKKSKVPERIQKIILKKLNNES
jgi:DNA repair exonuclease SbcCD nuclease subunit